MIEIGRAIVSFDIVRKHFLCDLKNCRGACCVEGDSGAPLTSDEAEAIERDYPVFQKFLPESHAEEIRKQGFSVTDSEGDLVTPLVGNRQCAYSFYDENHILKCAIEKAWAEGSISFRKPVSCHLFPIRITSYKRFDAVNYQELEICKPGRECGVREKLPLYRFLREPLIRKYGEEWYLELTQAARHLESDVNGGEE